MKFNLFEIILFNITLIILCCFTNVDIISNLFIIVSCNLLYYTFIVNNECKNIKELNDKIKCNLQKSKIDNIGVFAIRNINKGEKLYTDSEFKERDTYYIFTKENFNKLTKYVQKQILNKWFFVNDIIIFRNPNTICRLVCYINHSSKPNSDGYYALEDIKEGEEITRDYTKMKNYSLNLKQYYNFL